MDDGRDVITDVQQRVVTDDAFREALLSDPAGTLAREYGVGVPEGARVEVHEETDQVIHLVVPGRVSSGRAPDAGFQESMMKEGGGRTACCTCGSSTAQTFTSYQKNCGC